MVSFCLKRLQTPPMDSSSSSEFSKLLNSCSGESFGKILKTYSISLSDSFNPNSTELQGFLISWITILRNILLLSNYFFSDSIVLIAFLNSSTCFDTRSAFLLLRTSSDWQTLLWYYWVMALESNDSTEKLYYFSN